MAFLEEEHPQTLAIVLAHLSPTKAAEVLQRLAPGIRGDVMKRIAALEVVNAEALSMVELALQKHLEAVQIEPLGETGGIRAVAEILRAAGDGAETFLEDIRHERPDLAEEVGKQLFIFEDLVRLDDRAIQLVLKEVEPRCLALALKNALPEVKQKMFDNLSRRACELVREELELLGPVKVSDVEAARSNILDTVLRLEGSGQLFISGRGREENRIVY
jgi:flagellar motor switch protein FliG